jgi:uncharacterized damage-inducible protein DinB
MLTEEQIWQKSHPVENSLGNLLLHLSGNVRQWVIVGLGDVAWQRDRDSEFAAVGGIGRDVLLSQLSDTVEEANSVIGRMTATDLVKTLTVQSYEVTGLTTIYHVVEHFSYHTGQIAFETKRLTGQDLGFYSHLSERSVSVIPEVDKNTP